MCSVPWHPLGHDSLEENAVRYVMQRAIFRAKDDRSVAKVFDDAPYSVNPDLVSHLYAVSPHIATGGESAKP